MKLIRFPTAKSPLTPASPANLGRIDAGIELQRDVSIGATDQIGDLLDGDQPAVADDPDAVACTLHLVELVGRQKDGRAALALLSQ